MLSGNVSVMLSFYQNIVKGFLAATFSAGRGDNSRFMPSERSAIGRRQGDAGSHSYATELSAK